MRRFADRRLSQVGNPTQCQCLTASQLLELEATALLASQLPGNGLGPAELAPDCEARWGANPAPRGIPHMRCPAQQRTDAASATATTLLNARQNAFHGMRFANKPEAPKPRFYRYRPASQSNQKFGLSRGVKSNLTPGFAGNALLKLHQPNGLAWSHCFAGAFHGMRFANQMALLRGMRFYRYRP